MTRHRRPGDRDGSPRRRAPEPREDDIQIAALETLALVCPGAWARIFHVPNEQPQSQTPIERRRAMLRGKHLKAMGRKAGVPDLMLPVARGGAFGLAIEVKSNRPGARLSSDQRQWKLALESEGWRHEVCRSAASIVETVVAYMRQRPTAADIDPM